MGPIDIAIVTVVGLFAVLGLRRGLVGGVVDLVSLVVAFRGGGAVAPRLVPIVEPMGFGPATAAVAFWAAVIGVGLVVSFALFLIGRPLRRLPIPPPLPFLNSLFGIAPGVFKGLVASLALLIPLSQFQAELRVSEQLRASRLAPPLLAFAERRLGAAAEIGPIDLPFDPGQFDLAAPVGAVSRAIVAK